jgi:hypothetical protein
MFTHAIGASCSESSMNGMECNRIDWINQFAGFVLDSMTFERILVLLDIRIHIKILDSHAAFD